MNPVIEAIKTRRSVRSFKDAKISQKNLEEILQAGLYAPSARNTQNWQFTVVEDRGKLEQLRKVIADAIDNAEYHRFYNAPVLVIVSAPADYKYATADCSTALENIFLAAHSLGIGSVWINQLLDICDHPEVRDVLNGFNVPLQHRVIGCAALGYAGDTVKPDRENKGVIVYA